MAVRMQGSPCSITGRLGTQAEQRLDRAHMTSSPFVSAQRVLTDRKFNDRRFDEKLTEGHVGFGLLPCLRECCLRYSEIDHEPTLNCGPLAVCQLPLLGERSSIFWWSAMHAEAPLSLLAQRHSAACRALVSILPSHRHSTAHLVDRPGWHGLVLECSKGLNCPCRRQL